MADQQFSKAFRAAFWVAHGKTCLNGGQPVSFRGMVIDHVIPESLLKRPDDLRELLARLGLQNFDVLGYENLGLLCYNCNSTKRAHILPDGIIGTRLAIIDSHLPQLIAEIAKSERAKSVDQIIRLIEVSVEAGNTTLPEIITALRIPVENSKPLDDKETLESKIPPEFFYKSSSENNDVLSGPTLKEVMNALTWAGALDIRRTSGHRDYVVRVKGFCINLYIADDDALMVGGISPG